MSNRIDRRSFLAKGVLGTAAVGTAHVSIEERALAAAIKDGTAQAASASATEAREVDRKRVCVSTITFELPDPDEDVPRSTKAQNLEKARRLLDVAGQRSSDIVCLPELFNTKRATNQLEAEVIPGGETSQLLSEAARKWKMYAVGCYYERQGDDIYNAVALFGRRGEHIGTYHKVHLPIEEKEVAKPGGGYPVFQTDFGLVGAIVCLDIHFPEAARCLALDGAEIIFWPTMYSEPRESITNVLLRARAIENNLFMVASNYSQKRGIHIGFSAIVDTYGEILANTGRREGVATAVINLDDKLAVPGCNDWKTSRAVDSYRRIMRR